MRDNDAETSGRRVSGQQTALEPTGTATGPTYVRSRGRSAQLLLNLLFLSVAGPFVLVGNLMSLLVTLLARVVTRRRRLGLADVISLQTLTAYVVIPTIATIGGTALAIGTWRLDEDLFVGWCLVGFGLVVVPYLGFQAARQVSTHYQGIDTFPFDPEVDTNPKLRAAVLKGFERRRESEETTTFPIVAAAANRDATSVTTRFERCKSFLRATMRHRGAMIGAASWLCVGALLLWRDAENHVDVGSMIIVGTWAAMNTAAVVAWTGSVYFATYDYAETVAAREAVLRQEVADESTEDAREATEPGLKAGDLSRQPENAPAWLRRVATSLRRTAEWLD